MVRPGVSTFMVAEAGLAGARRGRGALGSRLKTTQDRRPARWRLGEGRGGPEAPGDSLGIQAPDVEGERTGSCERGDKPGLFGEPLITPETWTVALRLLSLGIRRPLDGADDDRTPQWFTPASSRRTWARWMCPDSTAAKPVGSPGRPRRPPPSGQIVLDADRRRRRPVHARSLTVAPLSTGTPRTAKEMPRSATLRTQGIEDLDLVPAGPQEKARAGRTPDSGVEQRQGHAAALVVPGTTHTRTPAFATASRAGTRLGRWRRDLRAVEVVAPWMTRSTSVAARLERPARVAGSQAAAAYFTRWMWRRSRCDVREQQTRKDRMKDLLPRTIH